MGHDDGVTFSQTRNLIDFRISITTREAPPIMIFSFQGMATLWTAVVAILTIMD